MSAKQRRHFTAEQKLAIVKSCGGFSLLANANSVFLTCHIRLPSDCRQLNRRRALWTIECEFFNSTQHCSIRKPVQRAIPGNEWDRGRGWWQATRNASPHYGRLGPLTARPIDNPTQAVARRDF